jgi:ATP-binding cassette subfamily F protein 3
MGCFLFRGDDVFKKIRVLSGGEKARVALAKTIISKANYLLLDEPTNHLDISSVKMLIQALNKFEGTYVLVSHDRYFIQHTANKIWEIEDGKISIFDGTYDEWEDFKKRKALAEKSKSAVQQEVVKEAPKTEVRTEIPKQNLSLQKEKNREEKKLRNQFNKLESDLGKMNFDKNRLELMLADPAIYSNKEKFQAAESEYNQISMKADVLKMEYEKLFEQLMEFES